MLVDMKQKLKMLLIGMPGADSSFYEMNIAQLPQGPRIKGWFCFGP
jgi:hypothetical protein